MSLAKSGIRAAVAPSRALPRQARLCHTLLRPGSIATSTSPRCSNWKESQTQTVRQSSTWAYTEEVSSGLRSIREGLQKLNASLAEPLHVMTCPPKDPCLKHPIIDKNRITVYSDTKHQFVPVPEVWLRDHCQCKECIHPDTRQRMLDTFEIPTSIAIDSASHDDAGISVKWNDGHESYYANDWLAKAALKNKGIVRQALTGLTLWSSTIKDSPPMVNYKDVMNSDEGVKQWVSLIREYGFCYVDGCPPTPEATKELLEKIAFIRITHYGGFYDFTSDLASKDTAYTNIALDAHTDTTYFSDPAGLQAFHLLSHTDGEGGASLLVDGFQAALDLQRQHPEAYEILSSVNIHAHASGNDGISIQPYRSFPVLQHDPHNHHLVQVRWNSSDRAAIDMPIEDVKKWYDAAEKWVTLLRAEEYEYWEQLKPGRPLIFDNWRVLHGRSAFTGKRRIAGAYINRDDFMSRYRNLNWGQDEVLKGLATA